MVSLMRFQNLERIKTTRIKQIRQSITKSLMGKGMCVDWPQSPVTKFAFLYSCLRTKIKPK